MSVVTVNRAIVPAVWPNNLGCATSGGFDLQVRESWQFVPATFDEMCDWATVVDDDNDDNATMSRVKHLVYTDETLAPDGKDLWTVNIILQGFVAACSLSMFGNWKGKPKDVQGAAQFLTLESGGFKEPFKSQVEALRNIRELIAVHVGAEVHAAGAEDDRIALRQPVFTKVRATQKRSSAVTLTDANDPRRAARKIADQWCIDHRINTSLRRKNGVNMPVVCDAIGRGDFVEVTISARIETVRTRKSQGSRVTFVMHDVVRLWSAMEAQAVIGLRVNESRPPPAEEQQTSAQARVVHTAPVLSATNAVAGGGGDGEEMVTDRE
ncbi:uncharacterized protein TRAVEDRAFT_42931 [Trametes versicolor FP-101664 SS1]|uniref:uncharacterized protein n=1 Tax=Trametes versicolor (strain FP-101664) TaxID=717944 RepID=UPI0004624800|nr:uncharacterized protein TRAVEDRAFT_42931 [Trametes versicolor FP-101664 SS1]EIW62573.1 hypothetical protein TRAVEDRAFT_42931 [Trametes versicolor FP-101664 SS1]